MKYETLTPKGPLERRVRPLLKVHFVAVGRGCKSWDAECAEEDLTEKWVFKQIRESKALMSRNLEFVIEGDEGTIFAGIHSVGKIRIEAA